MEYRIIRCTHYKDVWFEIQRKRFGIWWTLKRTYDGGEVIPERWPTLTLARERVQQLKRTAITKTVVE